MISIQIIIQACSLSSSLTNQHDTLGRQGYNASIMHLQPYQTFHTTTPNKSLFIYLNYENRHPVTPTMYMYHSLKSHCQFEKS